MEIFVDDVDELTAIVGITPGVWIEFIELGILPVDCDVEDSRPGGGSSYGGMFFIGW